VFNPNFFIEEDFYAVDKTAIEKFKLLSEQLESIEGILGKGFAVSTIQL
jgi:hypothetical protein